MEKNNKSSGKFVNAFLNVVEKVGNLLPEPASLFALLALAVVVLSGIMSYMQVEAIHPVTQAVVKPVNLLSIHGLHSLLTKTVTNFTGFAPLGAVLVALLGLGIAEGSGLMGTAIRLLVNSAPRKLLTMAVVLAGVLSHSGGDIGYVLVVPLGAIIFLAVGRHPIAGLAGAFAGVSGGYSANFLLGSVDPLLAGISQEAARILMPAYTVNPMCNYYFMACSAVIIVLLGTWVTEKIVEPRLGKYDGDEKPEELRSMTAEEKRGMKYALFAGLGIIAVILLGTIPENGIFRNPKTGGLLDSPIVHGIITLIFFVGAILGIAYGIGAKTVKSDKNVTKSMSKAMSTLASYIVLVFFAAQFVAYFKESNLGVIFALKGAAILKSLNLGTLPLMISFVNLSAFLNMFMGSASAKWAILSPVFTPMFMLLGYTPELIQVAYRIGDSVTNIISPMMSYFALIITFIAKYKKDAGIGTVVATMIPYSIIFLIGWCIFFAIWLALGLPVGPGAALKMAVTF